MLARRWGWLLSLFLMLVACTTGSKSSLTCDDLAQFQTQISREFTSQEEFIQWIIEIQAVSAEEIDIFDLPSTPTASYVWSKGGYRYSAELENHFLNEISISRDGSGGFQAHTLISCFGPPQVYRAIYDIDLHVSGGSLTFEMIFTEAGVIADGTRFYRNVPRVIPPIIDEDFTMDHLLIMHPGSAVEILRKAYGSRAQQTFQWMHPWPKNWADIKVDITPAMKQYMQRQ